MTEQPEPAVRRTPPLPMDRSREGLIDNLVTWYDELVVLDGVKPRDAARKAIDAAMPRNAARKPIPLGSWILLWILLAVIAAVVIPVVMYAIGHGLIPLWHWGTRW